jgi:threonine dehydrogenase-like Zn-dependent dehydrogenase
MTGVRLPGDSTVEHVRVEVPEPGHGQVLPAMRASSICGSDIRAIHREHLGTGPEAHQGVLAGHEPCGQVVAVGPGTRRLRPGDRVVALENTRTWGRCAFVGEGGQITFAVSEPLIHEQVGPHGSWVTSLRHREELLEHLVRWELHPERMVTPRSGLDQAADSHRVADGGAAGEVWIVVE